MSTLYASHAMLQNEAWPATIEWIADLLTGRLATCVAVLAIAAFGFATLRGDIDFKAARRIVLGCFILFGAPLLAAGLTKLARSQQSESALGTANLPTPSAPMNRRPDISDPYAGASVPKFD